MADRFYCSYCKSKGFEPSVTGIGCTFCDGTEGGNPPKPIKAARIFTQVGGRTVEIGNIIERLHDLLDEEELTDWETNFITDLYATYNERRKSVNWVSDGQLEQLERLYEKHY